MAMTAYAMYQAATMEYRERKNYLQLVPDNITNVDACQYREFSSMVLSNEPMLMQLLHKLYPSAIKCTSSPERIDGAKRIREITKHILSSLTKIDESNHIMRIIIEKDERLFYHSLEVMCMALFMGIHSESVITDTELYELGMAAILHDTGKIFLDSEILHLSHAPNHTQMKKIKQVPELSAQLLRKAPIMNDNIENAILSHQENFIGNGYPNAKKLNEIHPYGMIIHIADDYDSMIACLNAWDSYRSRDYAVNYIQRSAIKRYSLAAVSAFNKII